MHSTVTPELTFENVFIGPEMLQHLGANEKKISGVNSIVILYRWIDCRMSTLRCWKSSFRKWRVSKLLSEIFNCQLYNWCTISLDFWELLHWPQNVATVVSERGVCWEDWARFSIVGSTVNLLYQITIELTFEKQISSLKMLQKPFPKVACFQKFDRDSQLSALHWIYCSQTLWSWLLRISILCWRCCGSRFRKWRVLRRLNGSRRECRVISI